MSRAQQRRLGSKVGRCSPRGSNVIPAPFVTIVVVLCLVSGGREDVAAWGFSATRLSTTRRDGVGVGTALRLSESSDGNGGTDAENNTSSVVAVAARTTAPDERDDDTPKPHFNDESSTAVAAGLTKQEQILRDLGLGQESESDREARIAARKASEERLQSERRRNLLVASGSFALAVGNYAWRYMHPVTPVQILADMQSQSDDIHLIGRNGKPTVVDFWAPWCENCKGAAPTLQSIEEEYRDRVNFVLVNADVGENWNLIEKFGVDAIPHMAMVDERGYVETALIGPIPRSVLRSNLDVMLENAGLLLDDSRNEGLEVGTRDTTTDGEFIIPYDVKAVEVGGKGNGGEERNRLDLPYKMFDAFRNRPGERIVRF